MKTLRINSIASHAWPAAAAALLAVAVSFGFCGCALATQAGGDLAAGSAAKAAQPAAQSASEL